MFILHISYFLLLTNLEQPGQLGLPVRDVARLVRGEGLDDLAQAGEGQVDALALGEGVPRVGADASFACNSYSYLPSVNIRM